MVAALRRSPGEAFSGVNGAGAADGSPAGGAPMATGREPPHPHAARKQRTAAPQTAAAARRNCSVSQAAVISRAWHTPPAGGSPAFARASRAQQRTWRATAFSTH